MKLLWPVVLASILTTGPGYAAALDSDQPGPEQMDLLQLSLEELGHIKITSVSRKTESLSGAAAAIHVITQEDIRRSGVNLLPEAFRMAPGLQVARANSRKWAISSRGFNSTFANKLLVLMDGRTIYTPLFSGVFWEETDTVLEDIERIEVIRGPGAALWGANAVNGVINIMTKSARETQGLLLSGGGGIEERGFGTVRYGGKLSDTAHYRVYTKYSDRDEFTRRGGGGADDSWWMAQGGFRVDWEPSEINRFTLQGDYYSGELGSRVLRHSLTPPRLFQDAVRYDAEGGNLLGRWTHQFSAESAMSWQMYYDRTDRGFGVGREIRDTVDLDFQHHFNLGERQEIVWGFGYRYSVDDITETPDFQMRDPRVGLQLFSAFVQDEIALAPDRLHLTLGAKLEHNDFTGFELQPSGRLAWTPRERHTVWAAVSRAVRTPSRTERDFRIFADPGPLAASWPLGVIGRGSGNPDFGAEDLLAYELGYRVKAHARLSLDCAAFYSEYDDVQSVTTLPIELGVAPGPAPAPYLILPFRLDNDLYGESYGAEISATWQPLDAWRLRASYSFVQLHMHTKGPIRSISEDIEGSNPRHQVSLWSDVDLGRHVEWGMGLRYVDALPAPVQQIPSYTELDARLAWKPNRNCELAIVGSSLLHSHHREFSSTIIMARNVQVDRAIYAKLTLRF